MKSELREGEAMKIRIELDADSIETEVVIRTAQYSEEVSRIQEALEQANQRPIAFYRDTSEYFVELKSILFFETDGAKIYAHSKDNAYEVKLKLYELEERLPTYFCRISKSTIANTRAVYALDKSFLGTSTIHFYETHKQVHVSRHYYQILKEKLNETR